MRCTRRARRSRRASSRVAASRCCGARKSSTRRRRPRKTRRSASTSCAGRSRSRWWIVQNAGQEGSIVVSQVREAKNKNFGYNAQTDTFEDLVAAGVIDPTKVTRTALQNAASIAGLLLTTECVVVEKKEKEKTPPMPGGGGMGGMY